MSYKLFLDDIRNPVDCVHYMHKFIGPRNPVYLEEWTVARSYKEFVQVLNERGLPDTVSFDHDLSSEHYQVPNGDWEIDPSILEVYEDTGYDAAKYLVNYCIWNGYLLPECFVHSANPVGRERIINVLRDWGFKKEK